MDQIKIGAFLKTLRKEKNLTQEQAAEQLGVSNRTVSRWETGTNMPDIGLLLEIAELYGVSIPELIDGERKSEKMNEEAKEVASRMSDYAESEKTTILKNIKTESLLGVCALVVLMILELLGIRSSSQLTEAVFLYCQIQAWRQGKQLAKAIPFLDCFGCCRCSCIWNLVSAFLDRRINPREENVYV